MTYRVVGPSVVCSELLPTSDRRGQKDKANEMIVAPRPLPTKSSARGDGVSDSGEGSGSDTSLRAVIYARVSTKAHAERDGNPDGYSLPTQRTAAQIRAELLGATVIDEYIDKDTGTRVDKRPAMQAMIERITRDRDVDFVIVHQLSRFARNRLDDALVAEQLEQAGATLVSCLEGIDQTAAGRMMQGVLATVNEYQSRNQSDDIKRKTLQKVKDGGTPAMAPIGYLNVQGTDSDRNKRWVEVDEVRGPLITWAFSEYATGAYSLKALADLLEAKGLLQRATSKRPERPLPANKLHRVLRNPYYAGIVTFNGIQYQGKHARLVDPLTFETVQRMLAARSQSGERSHRRTHYLKGSLRCNRCKSRLAYCVSTGNGGSYAYFFCLGRHEGRTNCDLPHLRPELVESAVVDFYIGDQVTSEELEEIRSSVLAGLADASNRAESDRKRLIAEVTAIRHSRLQWAEKAMAEIIPEDIAKDKQRQLGAQLARAESELARLDAVTADAHIDIERVVQLAERAGESYRLSSDEMRKEWNFARFEALDIDVEDGQVVVAGAERTPVFEAIRTAEISPRPKGHASKRTGPAVICRARGSRVDLLVEVRGFEPLTS
jgi:DNA invertase Pin-like site-specific DNA recombinase